MSLHIPSNNGIPPEIRDHLQNLKQTMSVNKVSFRGKEIQLVGQAIALCEKLVNNVKKTWHNVRIKYQHGIDRKAVKKEIKSLLQKHTKIESTCYKILKEYRKPEPKTENAQKKQAKKIVRLNHELEKELNDFGEKFNKTINSLPTLKNALPPQTSVADFHKIIASLLEENKKLLKKPKTTSPQDEEPLYIQKSSSKPYEEDIEHGEEEPSNIPFPTVPAPLPDELEHDPTSTSRSPEDDIENQSHKKQPELPQEDIESLPTAFPFIPDAELEHSPTSSSRSSDEDIEDQNNDKQPDFFNEAPSPPSPALESVEIIESSSSLPKIEGASSTDIESFADDIVPHSPSESLSALFKEPLQPKSVSSQFRTSTLKSIPSKTTDPAQLERNKIRFQKALTDLESGRFSGKRLENLVRNTLKLLKNCPQLATISLNDGRWPLLIALELKLPTPVDTLLRDTLIDLQAGPVTLDAAILMEDDALIFKVFEAIMKREGALATQENPALYIETLIQQAKTQIASYSPQKKEALTSLYKKVGIHDYYPQMTAAIESNDLKAFIELLIDGADILAVNEKNQSLLHRVALQGNKQMALYLLLLNQIREDHQDNEGKSFIDLAQQNGWTDLIQLVKQLNEGKEKEDEALKNHQDLTVLYSIIAAYRKERQTYSPQMLAQKQEAAQQPSEINKFMEAVEMGAISIDNLDDTGCSPLHQAVEKGDSLSIVYLLRKYQETDANGKRLHPLLNPWQKNLPPNQASLSREIEEMMTAVKNRDFKALSKILEAEKVYIASPISKAALKGDFTALYLLLTGGNTHQEFRFNPELKKIQRVLELCKKYANMRDSLHITVQEQSKLFSSAFWVILNLATSYLEWGSNPVQIFFVTSEIARLAEDIFKDYKFQEIADEGILNARSPASMPAFVHKVAPLAGSLALLEGVTNSPVAIGSVAASFLRTYATINSAMPDLSKASKGLDRPKKAALKAVVNLTPIAKDVYSFGNTLFNALAPLSSYFSEEKPLTFSEESLKNLKDLPSKAALAKSPEYAEKVLKYFAARERIQGSTILELRLKANGTEEPVFDTIEQIHRVYRQAGLTVKDYPEEFKKLVNLAKEVSIERLTQIPTLPPSNTSWKIPGSKSILARTVFNVGLAWTLNQAAIATNYDVPRIAMGLMTFYGMGKWGYNYFKPASSEPVSTPAPQGPLSIGS